MQSPLLRRLHRFDVRCTMYIYHYENRQYIRFMPALVASLFSKTLSGKLYELFL
jgi:hypothetical protein